MIPVALGDLPDSQHDPAEVREQAEDILSRSEYNNESFLDRMLRAVDDFISDILESLGLSFGGGAAGALLGAALLAGLLAVVVGLVIWAIKKGVFGSGGRLRGAPPLDAVILAEDDRTAPEWLTAAEAHEAEGRWREGLLCRYRSLVVTLCDRGILAEVAGRTAGEYLREAETNLPAAAAGFTPATVLFEDVWYGGADSGPEERDRFVELSRVTEAAIGSGRRRASQDAAAATELVGTSGGEA